MAKPERNPAIATLKVDPELLRKAKVTVALEGHKLAEYIDGLLRGPIERDYSKATRKLAKGQQSSAGAENDE